MAKIELLNALRGIFCHFSRFYILSAQYKGSIGKENISRDGNQYVFGYPCDDNNRTCFPYIINLSPGIYKFEAWGSGSSAWSVNSIESTPGCGGYISGILDLPNRLQIYAFIGISGAFNALKTPIDRPYDDSFYPGAATDVRLDVNPNYEWYDSVSLRSRIFVAGGGGSSEWPGSIGGNGGGLNGTNGQSDCNFDGSICPDVISEGGTQISGGKATNEVIFDENVNGYGLNGMFGVSPQSDGDMGGIGGSGYYSGASFTYSGAGGGGSSFISGHPECVALKNSESEETSNSNVHYSQIKFRSTKMKIGNTTMPLYYSRHSQGKGNHGKGALRITILCGYPCGSDFVDYNSARYIQFMIFLPCTCE